MRSGMKLEDIWTATEQHLAREADSLGTLLERLRGRISPVLIGDREWQRLLERAHPLPATVAAFPFGFELPLHESEPRADFSVSVFGGSRSAAFFEDAGRAGGADPTAAGISRLLAAMEPEDAPLRRVAGRKMLLEYEIESTGHGSHPAPGVFLYPADDGLVGDGSPVRLRDLGLMSNEVASATGRRRDAATRRHVEAVYLAMRPDSCVRAVGAFPSGGGGLRLAITGFRDSGSVVAFLERAGWPGRPSFVAATVSRFEERGAFAYLGVHLDVHAGGVGTTLGLSLYAGEGLRLKDIRHWIPLLDRIAADRLAVPDKLSVLAESWSGAQVLFGRAGPFVLATGIHDMELVVRDDRIDEVKAYVFLLMLGALPS